MGRVWGGLSWNGPALNPRLLHPAPAPGAVAGPNQPPLGPRCRRRQRQSLAAPLARRLTALALRCPAHRRVEEEGRGARGRRLDMRHPSPACSAKTRLSRRSAVSRPMSAVRHRVKTGGIGREARGRLEGRRDGG